MSKKTPALIAIAKSQLEDSANTVEVYLTFEGWMDVGEIEEFGKDDVWLVTPPRNQGPTLYFRGEDIRSVRVRRAVDMTPEVFSA